MKRLILILCAVLFSAAAFAQTRVQLRRDTATDWTSENPTLAAGEPAVETDTGKFKLGDGATAWNSLAYATDSKRNLLQPNSAISVTPGTPDTFTLAWTDTVRTVTIDDATTASYSAPSAGSFVQLQITNSASTFVVLTVPTTYSAAWGANRTSWVIAPSTTVTVGLRYDGTTYQSFGDPGVKGAITFTLDGGGSAITTGAKGFIPVKRGNFYITSAETAADQSGSIIVDVWSDTYDNLLPTDADTITASAPPTLSSVQKITDSTLTGWTRWIPAGNYVRANVDSATTVTYVTVTLVGVWY
jgi:hypothetical protein